MIENIVSIQCASLSPLAEGRELKYNLPVIYIFNITSPLAEGRELKWKSSARTDGGAVVAPRGGA